MSVDILTKMQPICWLIYRPPCRPAYRLTIGQYFASIKVDTVDMVTKIFQKSLMPGVFPGWEHGLFWNRSVQNADYRMLQTIVFTMQSELDNNSPIDCFLTLKTMVCIQSAVCILYSPVLEWTGTLVRKCVHKQSYINYKNGSLHQILTNSGKPTFDIFSFITSNDDG